MINKIELLKLKRYILILKKLEQRIKDYPSIFNSAEYEAINGIQEIIHSLELGIWMNKERSK